ncbi:leucine-rich repeat-containing protein 19-like isoform X2 [Morone saxatilis]|uniref:leucine-rich repeat-containing protein 19-like isoform X2 n=1 Tax=Morone saxatilis TaxID=34816 RepID=UPI0015E25230|nr:leucine-rich repeat-containing protein 19-like isoform X2 [Morone saxatilis]
MERCRHPPLLLWFTAAVAMNILGGNAALAGEDKLQVKNWTNNSLKVIPQCNTSCSVTKLLIEGNLITLNKADRLALASYTRLVELHLGGNLVTGIPAKYFSVVPHLRVLSLSGNKISSLDPESFSGLDDLTEVDLSHNLLTSLHTQLFRQLKTLQVLNLQENPWNCSCPLLSSIGALKAAGVTIGGPRVSCASPENQVGTDLLEATAVCYPSAPAPTFTTDQHKMPVNIQQSRASTTVLQTTLKSQNHNNKDQTPVLGNSWKFTACVVALALFTSMLIVCAIKGPSWYRLFHNYRHRRLRQEEDGDAVSTVFSDTGTHLSHQTFTFRQDNGRMEGEQEEEEDGYFEDPYIKREE